MLTSNNAESIRADTLSWLNSVWWLSKITASVYTHTSGVQESLDPHIPINAWHYPIIWSFPVSVKVYHCINSYLQLLMNILTTFSCCGLLICTYCPICQQICKIQQWPQDWKRSVFIPIPKKGNAKECSNYRTSALISHASKVKLKILQARLQ